VTETSLQGSTSGTIFRLGTAAGHIDVTIKGLTIDGHNAALAGGRTLNGVSVNTGAGIINSIGSFDANPGGYDVTMIVQNNILQNLERYGVLIDGTPSTAPRAGNDVSFNKIDNLPSGNNFGGARGRAAAFEENVYGTFSNNVVTRVNVGWQDDNYYLASPGAGTVVTGNNIKSYHRGIFHNLQYQNATGATISNNTIAAETSGDFPASSTNFGIELASIQSAVPATVTNNNVSGTVYGLLLWNLPTTGTVNISGGTLTGNQYGVFATSNDPQFGAGAASKSSISGVTIVNSTAAGIAIDNSANIAGVELGISGGTSISGGPTGLLISGPNTALTGNSLDGTSFALQTGNYIKLTGGALAGQTINGTATSYDGIVGNSATLAQSLAIEDKITHAIDAPGLGFIRVKNGQVFVTPNSYASPVTTAADIQRGVDAAASGDTVNVSAGNYASNITINKPLNLLGANAGIAGSGSRGAESVVTTKVNDTSLVNGSAPNVPLIHVLGAGSGVTIDGFTIDGINPALGSQISASGGIFVDGVSAATIKNNVVQNFVHFGVSGLGDSGSSSVSINNLITANKFQNILGQLNFGYGEAVDASNNFYATITNNVISNIRRGMQLTNNYLPNTGAPMVVSGNTLDVGQTGIWVNLWYESASGLTVSNNDLNSTFVAHTFPPAADNNRSGVFFASLDSTIGPITASGNTIHGGYDFGVQAWNNAKTVTVSGGTISGAGMIDGVRMETSNATYGDAGFSGALTLDGVQIQNAPTGIVLDDNSPNSSTIALNLMSRPAALPVPQPRPIFSAALMRR
jgi:hypothetical protein